MFSKIEDLQKIEEIGPVIAESIVEFFSNQTNIKLIYELLERGVVPSEMKKIEVVDR